MEVWQMVISVCAGIITILTVLEKLGITNKLKKADADFGELRKLLDQIAEIQQQQYAFGEMQKDQNMALLALLRNDLYQSFKDNRSHGVWTDDESTVQTKLHVAYQALQGNGEEQIWWDKKKTWKIVTPEEYAEIHRCGDRGHTDN